MMRCVPTSQRHVAPCGIIILGIGFAFSLYVEVLVQYMPPVRNVY
jgi:hypothetical protein